MQHSFIQWGFSNVFRLIVSDKQHLIPLCRGLIGNPYRMLGIFCWVFWVCWTFVSHLQIHINSLSEMASLSLTLAILDNQYHEASYQLAQSTLDFPIQLQEHLCEWGGVVIYEWHHQNHEWSTSLWYEIKQWKLLYYYDSTGIFIEVKCIQYDHMHIEKLKVISDWFCYQSREDRNDS